MKLKKLMTIMLSSAITLSMMTVSLMADETEIPIDEEHFPDPVFRQYVLDNHDGDKNGILSDIERDSTSMNLQNMGIESLQGIEYFENLTELDCSMNEITDLDISHNTALFTFQCYCNKLTVLDVSNNTGLAYFNARSNQLTEIDVSNNVNLVMLEVSLNPIESIDISNISNLRDLSCYSTLITELDVSNQPDLNYLTVYDTGISELDISANTNLTGIFCYDCNLSSLDLSNNSELYRIDCHNNQISSLNLKGKEDLAYVDCSSNCLTELDVSDNIALIGLLCNNNRITELNLDNNPSVNSLDVSGNDIEVIDISGNAALLDYYGEMNLVNINEFKASHNPDEITGLLNLIYDDSAFAYVVQTDYGWNTDFVFSAGLGIIVVDGEYPEYPAAVPETAGVQGFAERLYTCALGRDFDEEGKAYWVDALRHGTTGAEAAYGFLFSEEVIDADITDEEFILRLYATLMDREPAADEIAYWTGAIADGSSREDVFAGFIHSTEWANICVYYGILSGGSGVPSIEVDPSQNIIDFATRLYTTCLCREADEDGLEWWAKGLANLRVTGTYAAQSYFFSDEFVDSDISDQEFINRLYLTFMDREADDNGRYYWIGCMDDGMSREDVFGGFASSDEFGDVCADYGIIR